MCEPWPDKFNVIFWVDPEDVEVSWIKLLVDQMTEGAHFRKLFRSQIVIGTKKKNSKICFYLEENL
jgi:hypothetical protein